MIKKFVSKFTIDILPSIIATIVGAYIVNHYIVPKSGDAPAAATAASTVEPVKAAVAKPPARPAETSADVANGPDGGAAKPRPSDKPADTASLPADGRRHQPVLRDKAVARTTPAPVAPVAPPIAAASVTPAGDATADERRDANDLARAAIERLRGTNEAQPRPQEAARAPEAVRAPEPPRVATAPSIQPLPPAIMVSTPPAEAFNPGLKDGSSRPSYTPSETIIDPRRPRPPGDIPLAQPLDIQADATGSTRRERTSVAEDVLSAAKSVFHSLPRPFEH